MGPPGVTEGDQALILSLADIVAVRLLDGTELPRDVRDTPVLFDDLGRFVPAELSRVSPSLAVRRRQCSALTGRCCNGPEPICHSVPVDVPAVTYPDDVDDEVVVEDLVDDPIVPDSHPVDMRFSGHRHTSRWAWLLSQEIDRRSNPLLVPAGEALHDLCSTASDPHLVGAHVRPSSAFTCSQGTKSSSSRAARSSARSTTSSARSTRSS